MVIFTSHTFKVNARSRNPAKRPRKECLPLNAHAPTPIRRLAGPSSDELVKPERQGCISRQKGTIISDATGEGQQEAETTNRNLSLFHTTFGAVPSSRRLTSEWSCRNVKIFFQMQKTKGVPPTGKNKRLMCRLRDYVVLLLSSRWMKFI